MRVSVGVFSHAPCWRRVLKWLKAFADERSLAWQQDAVGNLVIKRTGCGGGESAPAVVIQARQLVSAGHAILDTSICFYLHQSLEACSFAASSRAVLHFEPFQRWASGTHICQSTSLSSCMLHKYLAWIAQPLHGGLQAAASNVQGHVDMVTEKNNNVDHDFFNDPLRLQSDGSWLKVPYCHSNSSATS